MTRKPPSDAGRPVCYVLMLVVPLVAATACRTGENAVQNIHGTGSIAMENRQGDVRYVAVLDGEGDSGTVHVHDCPSGPRLAIDARLDSDPDGSDGSSLWLKLSLPDGPCSLETAQQQLDCYVASTSTTVDHTAAVGSSEIDVATAGLALARWYLEFELRPGSGNGSENCR